MLSTFLSISTPKRKDQSSFLERLKLQLNKHGIKYNTVENVNPNKINPIYPIIDAIRKSSFCICIAFEKNKERNRYTTSNWIDIEYALALSMNKPCFIVAEKHLGDTQLINQNTPSPLIYIPTIQQEGQFVIDFNKCECTWKEIEHCLLDCIFKL